MGFQRPHLRSHKAEQQRIAIAALPFCRITLRSPKPLGRGYPTDPKTIGERLKRRRLELGLLQQEVAKALRVRVETARNWEGVRTGPQGRFLSRFVWFLGGKSGICASS